MGGRGQWPAHADPAFDRREKEGLAVVFLKKLMDIHDQATCGFPQKAKGFVRPRVSKGRVEGLENTLLLGSGNGCEQLGKT